MKFMVDEMPFDYSYCPFCKEEWNEKWVHTCSLTDWDCNLHEKEGECDGLKRVKEQTVKPIRIDGFTEKCPKCGEKVMYAVGTGTIFHGASESYEDWRVIKHNYCPRCGTKIEREGADDE